MIRASLIAFAGAALLCGCTADEHGDLKKELAELTKDYRGRVEPLPQVKPYEPVPYTGEGQVDPFRPERIEVAQARRAGGNAKLIEEQRKRPPEPLEAFPLESIQMLGTITQGKETFALVKAGPNLYRVLRSELEWNISRVLKAVPGVADVVTFGGYLKEVHVRPYPDRLRAHGLTLGDVAEALAKSNINVGGGFVRHGDQELTVRGMGYITSVDDIRRTVLKTRDATPVTVGDVAEIVQSNTPRRGAVGWNTEKEAV